jgi:ABC-2 type transport system permease protein
MNFIILLKDELKGFYKSSVMIILWIGLPLLCILFYLFARDSGEELSLSFISASIISSIGGWLAAIMLAIYIIHEKSKHVYELFLVRPVKRRSIIVSKFLAVFFCVFIASCIALIIGFIVDYLFLNKLTGSILSNTLESFVMSFSIIAIECSAGALVGVFASSVLVGIILIVIGHNIASMPFMLSMSMKQIDPLLTAIILCVIFTFTFLILAVYLFNKKQF